MPIEMLLSPAALAWIGGAFENKTRVSPMSNLDPSGFTPAARESLISQGVLDSDGKITPACYVALKDLAAAESYCRLRYSGGPTVIEKTVYFGPGSPVSVDNTSEGLYIECPAQPDPALESLSQFTGAGRLMNSELAVELDYDPALVLATIIDMRRRDILRAYADAVVGFIPRPYGLEQISLALASAPDSPRWLGSIVKQMKAQPTGSAGPVVEQALAGLASAGLVVTSADGFDLTGEAAAFASTFLVVDGIMHIQTGAEGPGGVIRAAECVFVHAGLNDIVSIDCGGGKVSIEAVSGAMLREYARRFLTTKPSFA